MNSHSKWLRTWAAELRKEGVIGGANTAEQAADEIDRLESVLSDTNIRLRMYGGHTANCAYHLSHYKGPVSSCDCKWTDLVPAVFDLVTYGNTGAEHG
jgi:hypothetical protein